MKKFISLVMSFVLAYGIGASIAQASAVFNSPGSMPTITITNATTNPCTHGSIDGCWKTSATARPGDTVSVQVYYKNTSNEVAQGASVQIKPGSTGSVSSVTFTGGVGSLSGPASMGSAHLSITGGSQTLTYVQGSGRWYKNDQSGTFGISSSMLFDDGMPIGAISPGQQGVIAVDFKVSGTIVEEDYQCSDGYDNDGDGYIDYPNDPGCSSSNDDSEYNVVVPDDCSVDISASDTSISEGDSTVLSWTSSDCTSLSITDLGSVNASGTERVYLSNDKTYTIVGYSSSGQRDEDSVHISVDEDNDDNGASCTIDSFDADDRSLTRGQTTSLRWQTRGDVTSVNLSGVGNVSEDGSQIVAPYSDTSYTLRAYCGNGSTDTDSVTLSVSGGQVGTRPQAVTTVATVLTTNAARLNGIAIPNTTATTYAWFEWGPYASLGSSTARQLVTSSINAYVTDGVQGLVPGTAYYYRTVVQNQYGTAYGDIVRFQTTGAVQTTTTVVKYVPQAASTVIVAKSAPSLLELKVESIYDHMCVGGEIEYRISYRNISSTQTLQNAVLRIALPKEMDYVAGTGGTYSVVDRTLTIPLGNLLPGAQGGIQLRAHVNGNAVPGNLAVTTATVVYTNTVTHAQEDAIAYSLVTISNECPNLLGASAFGLSFLPHTLLGWLLLILVILALIVLGRQLYKKTPTA